MRKRLKNKPKTTTSPFKIQIGILIRERREVLGLDQLVLGDALGYSNGQFVSNWERGVSTPPPKIIPSLCILLGINPEVIWRLLEKDFSHMLRSV